MELYAWIGEDELGSGKIGIKQARTPAGLIPIVVTDYDHDKAARLAPAMQRQADAFGKTIRLARFAFVEDVIVLDPRPQG